MHQYNKTRTLVECAVMIAAATVLSMISLFELPQGGTVTPAATLPLILIAHRHGLRWGLFTGFTHGLLQTMMGMKNVMAAGSLGTMILCALLDYVLAYTLVGAAVLFEKPFPRNKRMGIALGSVVVGLGRFACSFVSGILIWGAYAPPELPVWLYSLQYNGSFMIPEIIITTLAAVALIPVLDRLAPAAKTAG